MIPAVACDGCWDLTLPAPIPRSRCYALPPQGVGTPLSESLSSYVERLAAAHCVAVRDLVMHAILPEVAAGGTPMDVRGRWYWTTNASAINGISGSAQAWTHALERLTGGRPLTGLTWQRWQAVVAPRNLLRSYRAWCPHCYADWHATHQVIYDPLLWGVRIVTHCPIHATPLVDHCPHCARPMPILARWRIPGTCATCQQWLGTPPSISATSETMADHACAHLVGSLLAIPADHPSLPAGHVATLMTTLLDRIPEHGISVVAQHLHVSRTAVMQWSQGRGVPTLANLVRISRWVEIPLVRLVTDPEVFPLLRTVSLRPRSDPPPQPRPRPQTTTRAERQQALEAILADTTTPPPSMRAVGRQLGAFPSALARQFPALCRAVSARYRAQEAARRSQRQASETAMIQAAVLTLHATGVFPTLDRVRRQVPQPGILASPAMRAVWQAAVAALDGLPPTPETSAEAMGARR